ncbi:uncharacterized protein LY89DRAFT_278133 [Mollisia scopiformis]|uniref:Secreted protein n=1 Tax=Mollisia scopiformis TaxID=149040 RepID=A0A132BBR2_MOLSC|nr:uncharacterized protein LY89DRAFT_278133 [Mollisia scopiformis]KUJ09836.1 hypothetical protein LY89DRAFT_278133 [Mollisia scopiformis]
MWWGVLSLFLASFEKIGTQCCGSGVLDSEGMNDCRHLLSNTRGIEIARMSVRSREACSPRGAGVLGACEICAVDVKSFFRLHSSLHRVYISQSCEVLHREPDICAY